MLPLPVRQFISKVLTQRESAATTSLISKMQEHLLEWKQEALDLRYVTNPVRVNSNFIEELGALVAAPIRPGDSERVKRQKTVTAVANHKLFGTWEFQAKGRIDAITGQDSDIVSAGDTSDWILLGNEASDPDRYWATLGIDGIDDDLGIDLIGAFDEVVIAGNIYIDLHPGINTPILSASIIEELVSDISDPDTGFAPAYYVLYLGYFDATGTFVVYDTV